MTSSPEFDRITAAAAAAAPAAAAASDEDRARWLEAIAAKLDAATDELVAVADRETSLGTVRLTGEVARTTGQLRLFAGVVREGSYLEATIDHANPDGTPPSPDLRRVLRPLGPVGVFGASNFPFAFSVMGGDTASALAVGCPVVYKVHPGHPELSARTAVLVAEALAEAGAPDGVFGMVDGYEAGIDLVRSPAITAVGFTGSLHGGRALFDIAVSRPDPIPFYGELGSLNPVLVTRSAATERTGELATGLAGSMTLGVGQFCTKPGVVLVPEGTGFENALATALGDPQPGAMLTDGLAESYASGVARLAALESVDVLVGDADGQHAGSGSAVVLGTTAEAVLDDPDSLLVECFGPTTLLVRYGDETEATAVLAAIGGTLTATLHAEPTEAVDDLVDTLSNVAGRVLFGGWPTGVAVNYAQQHGGPWPSTTNALHTSVGAASVRRWLRPVSYQSAADAWLPPALREDNPLGIPRRVDGVLVLP